MEEACSEGNNAIMGPFKRLIMLVFSPVRLQTQQRRQLGDIVCMAADIQFIRGVNEPSIPDVNLTRARDGSTGTATFVFPTPSVFEASSDLGEITGLLLLIPHPPQLHAGQ